MTRPYHPPCAALPIDLPARSPAGRYPILRTIWPAVEAGALYAGTSRFGIPTARGRGWSHGIRRRATDSNGGGAEGAA